MAAMDETWSLAKGIHDLGIGFFAHLQHDKSALEPSMAADSRDKSRSSESAGVQESIATARKSLHKALDCQLFIVSLFTKGPVQLLTHLRLLEGPFTQDVDAMIAAADNDDCARTMRDFKARLDSLTLAYEPLVDRLLSAAESGANTLPKFALRDAMRAESQANTLYSWARTFVPKDVANQTAMDKTTKIKMMPYIVIMAYAVRVKLDVHYVESTSVVKAEKAEYLERSRKVVDEFVALLRVTTNAILDTSSLLDVAIDYHLALGTYIALMAALRKSVQMLLTPADAPQPVALWDDGLADIRAAFCRENNGIGKNIPLTNVKESFWWAQFLGLDLDGLEIGDLRKRVQLREVLFILGADLDADDIIAIRFTPDYKRRLLQLPPAQSLRSGFYTKLTAVLGASSTPLAQETCARIQSAQDLPAAPAELIHLSRTLEGHSNFVCGLALGADGERVVSASLDQKAKVWSATTGQLLSTFAGHSAGALCVALFSDGTRAVSGGGSGDKAVRIWNLDSGTQVRSLTGHTGVVFGVAVSPDNCTIASAGGDSMIKLWNAHSGSCEATLTGHNGYAFCVAFSLDGRTLISSGHDKTIKVWSVHSRSLVRTLTGHTDAVRGVAFTVDGERLISASWDKEIKVWNWRTGNLDATLTFHTNQVYCVAVFPDGERVASGSQDKTIQIWNVCSKRLEHTLQGHTGTVRCLAVSRDGSTLVSGSEDKSVKVWRLD